MSTKFYVVLEQGVEYNDETHYIGGKAKVNENAYSSKEEARAAAKEKLKKALGGFYLYDFDSEYLTSYPVMVDFIASRGGVIKSYGSGYKYFDYNDLYIEWSEFIKWCEDSEREWISCAPKLYEIAEVTYDG